MIYTLRDVRYKHILSIDDLMIGPETVTCITGPSGCGKTTLLRLLCKLTKPDTGTITLDGIPLSESDTLAFRRKVTMLPQIPVLYEGDIKDNLLAGFTLRGDKPPSDEELLSMLQSLGLEKSLGDETRELSGGEKQRLCMGRALILRSSVYLFDEPSASLDAKTADVVLGSAVRTIRNAGSSLIMVSHSKELCDRYADRVIKIERGQASC